MRFLLRPKDAAGRNFIPIGVGLLDLVSTLPRGVFGCAEGRSTGTLVDFSFFGHPLSLHLGRPFATSETGNLGAHLVPMPHLGVVLHLPDWQALATRLQAAGVEFVLLPSVRFQREPGEQWTMFLRAPSGNPIEIKGFPDPAWDFAQWGAAAFLDKTPKPATRGCRESLWPFVVLS